MRVVSWVTALVCVALSAATVAAQGAAGSQAPSRPGGVVGAPTPGLPPRDSVQRPKAGTARIRGRIVASPGGTPLRHARLELQSSLDPELGRTVVTDAQGRYEFSDLPAGRYSLFASKPAYVQLQYGQRRPFESGAPLVLRDGETLTSIDFALPRGSVVTGRITDEANEPLPEAEVQVQRFQYTPDGQRRLSTSGRGTSVLV